MTENQLINNILRILQKENEKSAYEYLLNNKEAAGEKSSQIYNFLYCLAAASGKEEEAIRWLEEAIYTKGFWYRSAVFEDDDLKSVREDLRFQKCKEISDSRYEKEQIGAKTISTWKEVKEDKIALVLHGNQQNITICQKDWEELKASGYQAEYVQSKILDSYQLYRWEEEEKVQLLDIIHALPWENYKERLVCGFSAGCNEILRAISLEGFACEKIILQSPWIPMINDKSNTSSLFINLKQMGTKVMVLCGTLDEDCLPLAREFVKECKKFGVNMIYEEIEGLKHDFSEDFMKRVEHFLGGR